jgi:hypothetical protein
MKKLQVIEGALNCTFSIFTVADEDFSRLFQEPGQEISLLKTSAVCSHKRRCPLR